MRSFLIILGGLLTGIATFFIGRYRGSDDVVFNAVFNAITFPIMMLIYAHFYDRRRR